MITWAGVLSWCSLVNFKNLAVRLGWNISKLNGHSGCDEILSMEPFNCFVLKIPPLKVKLCLVRSLDIDFSSKSDHVILDHTCCLASLFLLSLKLSG